MTEVHDRQVGRAVMAALWATLPNQTYPVEQDVIVLPSTTPVASAIAAEFVAARRSPVRCVAADLSGYRALAMWDLADELPAVRALQNAADIVLGDLLFSTGSRASSSIIVRGLIDVRVSISSAYALLRNYDIPGAFMGLVPPSSHEAADEIVGVLKFDRNATDFLTILPL